MKLFAYSIYDTKAETYNQPFFCSSNGLAMRSFTEVANDPNTTIAKYPTDFHLYRIGTFDTVTATLESETPLAFGSADQYLQKDPDQSRFEDWKQKALAREPDTRLDQTLDTVDEAV